MKQTVCDRCREVFVHQLGNPGWSSTLKVGDETLDLCADCTNATVAYIRSGRQ